MITKKCTQCGMIYYEAYQLNESAAKAAFNGHKCIVPFHRACQDVINNQDKPALNYAVGYAKHGLKIKTVCHAAHVQALYLRSNLSSWRGPFAKETRNRLDNFIKATKKEAL